MIDKLQAESERDDILADRNRQDMLFCEVSGVSGYVSQSGDLVDSLGKYADVFECAAPAG